MDKNDINILLEKWYTTKQQIQKLESNLEKYKKAADRLMNKKDTNQLVSSEYSLKRRENSRLSISRNDVPTDIWNKYSKRSNYKSFYILKNN